MPEAEDLQWPQPKYWNKLLAYNAVILSTLLYGLESWPMYRHHLKALDRYHYHCLRQILHISWEDRCMNINILQESNCTSIEAMIIQNQLHWASHVVRMPDCRLAKHIFWDNLRKALTQEENEGSISRTLWKSISRNEMLILTSWSFLLRTDSSRGTSFLKDTTF